MRLIELKSVDFVSPTKLDRETQMSLWNTDVAHATRMFLDTSELSKLMLVDKNGDVVRFIPYHMVSNFKTLEGHNLKAFQEAEKPAKSKK